MQKLLIAVVIICLLLVFSACGGNGNTVDDGSQSYTSESSDTNTDNLQTSDSVEGGEEVTSSEKWTNNY